MTLKRIFVLLSAAFVFVFVLVAIAGSREARVCEGPKGLDGMEEVILIGAATLVTDVVVTGYDLYKLGKDERPGRGFGLFETLLATPQLVLALSLMSDGAEGSALYVYTAWMALLAGHGIYTMFSPDERPVPSPVVTVDVGEDAKMSFLPTLVSDGHELGGGVGAVLQW